MAVSGNKENWNLNGTDAETRLLIVSWSKKGMTPREPEKAYKGNKQTTRGKSRWKESMLLATLMAEENQETPCQFIIIISLFLSVIYLSPLVLKLIR